MNFLLFVFMVISSCWFIWVVIIPFLCRTIHILLPKYLIVRSPNGKYWIQQKVPFFLGGIFDEWYWKIDYINAERYETREDAIKKIKKLGEESK